MRFSGIILAEEEGGKPTSRITVGALLYSPLSHVPTPDLRFFIGKVQELTYNLSSFASSEIL